MRMFGATVVFVSFFFKSYGPNKVQFFFLGINSRGIFQVNFDLCICSVPVAVKSNQIFWDIFHQISFFLQHCPVIGKHILTILNEM